MADTNNANAVAANLAAGVAKLMGGQIPQAIAHAKRFAFVILIDTSLSTTVAHRSSQTDIDAISAALPQIFKVLREPERGSPIHLLNKQIDVAVMTYSDAVQTPLLWTAAPDLPDSLPPFVSGNGTYTAMAFEKAFELLKSRQVELRGQKVGTGLAHIIHITDGAPTDMKPGSAKWTHTQALLATNIGSGQLEIRKSALAFHFVTPNGCDPDFVGNKNHPSGFPTGLKAMAELAESTNVFDIKTGMDLIPTLIQLVTGTIVRLVDKGGTIDQAASQAIQAIPAAIDRTVTPQA